MSKEDRPKRPKSIRVKIYPELFPLGVEEAIMISDFINTWVEKYKKGLLDEEGFFNYPRLEVSKRLDFGKNFQSKVLKTLEYLRIIEVKISKKSKGKGRISTRRLIRLKKETFSTAQNPHFSTYLSGTLKNEDNYLNLKAKLCEVEKISYIINSILLYYICFNNTILLSKYKSNKLDSYLYNNIDVLLKHNCPDKSGQRKNISFFNSLGNLRRHNRVFGDRLSKTYIKCEKQLNLLKEGILYQRYRLDKAFLERHKIPNPINKKFTDREIMTGFKNLSLLVEEGYGYITKSNMTWPNASIKEKIRKLSIDQLLFHSVTRHSWFLMALYNKPKNFCEQLRIPFEKKYLNIFSSILPNDFRLKQGFIYTIDSIIKAQDFLIGVNKLNWNAMSLGYKGDPENFLKKYFWFVQSELGIDNNTESQALYLRNNIRAKNFWNSFCNFLKNEFFLENTDEAKKIFK